MATIRFKDHTTKYVEHYQAAKVYQVLIGNEPPENEAQAAFIKTVESVEFPVLPMPDQPAAHRRHSPETIKERRRRVKAIMDDPSLSGKQKYHHAREVLYGHPVPPEGQQQLV